MKLVLRFLVPFLCIFSLTACGVQGSYTDQLPDPADLSDPRSFEGVSDVKGFDEIEPVTDKAEPALPVELTAADGTDVTDPDASRKLPFVISATATSTLCL